MKKRLPWWQSRGFGIWFGTCLLQLVAFYLENKGFITAQQTLMFTGTNSGGGIANILKTAWEDGKKSDAEAVLLNGNGVKDETPE